MKGRVEQLDGLRGIFAVLVVAHHHNAFKDSIFYNNFFVINSDLFVDFFFVLSGFVIALNYYSRLDTKEDFFLFLKKRFVRLYPLLFYTEIVFLVFNIIGDFSSYKNAGNLGMSYYLQTVMDTLTFMGSTPIFGDWIGLNYPAWSISAEMIAYIAFGLTLLLFSKYRFIVFVITTILCGAFIIQHGDYLLAYDFGFIRGIFCFTLGVFTYNIIRNRSFQLSAFEVPFLLAVVLGMYIVHDYGLNLWKLVFPFLFSGGVIIFCNSTGMVTRLLLTKPFQYLGKISYSIYLNHAIVLIAMNVILFRIFKSAQNELMIGLSLVISIALTIIYSHFTYEWIEVRVGRFLRSKI
jgi:peptidoglycan/LPS O-acetylase OafA/YrhL